MCEAFGIVNFAGSHIHVKGLQKYRPLGAVSFLGRYRLIDFPISNMTNSGIEQIQVYINRSPRSLVEHIGTGRHYNINSKSGKLHILFAEYNGDNTLYNNDIAAFYENLECIEAVNKEYVVIAPSYIVHSQNYDELLTKHIDSGADITLLYHTIESAKENCINCDVLELNRQKGVEKIKRNQGTRKTRHIFLNTYVMKKSLLIQLVKKAKSISSIYTLMDIVNHDCANLDVRGVAHKGYFSPVVDFQTYFRSNMSLINIESARTLFDAKWPILTKTNDSCPSQYLDGASVKNCVVSNGCVIEGVAEHSVIGRGCTIGKNAVVRNSVLLPGAQIGEGAVIEYQVVDKFAKIIHAKELIATEEKPGYVHRKDIL